MALTWNPPTESGFGIRFVLTVPITVKPDDFKNLKVKKKLDTYHLAGLLPMMKVLVFRSTQIQPLRPDPSYKLTRCNKTDT